MNMVRSGC